MSNFWVSSVEIRGGIYPETVIRFRERIQPGDKLTCFTGRSTETKPEGENEEETRCTVRKKYPYIALTTKGCFQWAMLALWNRNLAK